jgi:hypothetical protein
LESTGTRESHEIEMEKNNREYRIFDGGYHGEV